MFSLRYSKRFKKDLKLFEHEKDTLFKLAKILDFLIAGKPLPKNNYNHPLSGEFKGCFECHI
ncbi:type II toxin-antitoxin system mRNA interferase toxin, RelE/StbE family, partial [Patescibacteria group bacterium]|nr:type II toxin-antitoxin system mRNA interferase toxin, RelE/StbE family [Patescibacteria group bacterium]